VKRIVAWFKTAGFRVASTYAERGIASGWILQGKSG
jgi:hypothetical protein